MFRRRLLGLLLGASVAASSASAQQQSPSIYELTLERALELARRQAPDLVTARARVIEAGGQVESAAIWPFAPQLQTSAGPRFQRDDTIPQWSVGATQWLELGGQRGHRIEAARAGVDAAAARSEHAERLLLRAVGLAFVQMLYWERRVALAEENLRIAGEIARVALRKYEVGEAGGLEESVAALALDRVQAEHARARAALGQVDGRVKVLLGIDESAVIVTRGDLRQLATVAVTPSERVEARPDVRALAAEIRQAEAQADLGRAARVPNLGLGASYAREEQADIVQGTLTVALPLFDRGQGTTAVAEGRRARIETELRAARGRAAVEVDTALATARALGAAVRAFEQRGLATLERVERISTASYEAGAIPLGELLAVRRELVSAKLEYTDLLMGAATARVELAASTGAFR